MEDEIEERDVKYDVEDIETITSDIIVLGAGMAGIAAVKERDRKSFRKKST